MHLNRETYVSYVTAPEGRSFIQHQQKEREKQRKQTKDSDTQNVLLTSLVIHLYLSSIILVNMFVFFLNVGLYELSTV